MRSDFSIDGYDYLALLEAQGNGCGICGIEKCLTGRRFAVDHDHSCCPAGKSCGGCVRGLLCYRCNCYLVGTYERLPESQRDWPRLNAYLEGRIK